MYLVVEGCRADDHGVGTPTCNGPIGFIIWHAAKLVPNS